MENEKMTKKEHFITSGYIAQFSHNKLEILRESRVYYYDLRTQKTLETESEKLPLAEDWYFEINNFIIGKDNKVTIVKNSLDIFENAYLHIINEDRFLTKLNIEKISTILYFIIHLYLRSPKKREMILIDFKKVMNGKYFEKGNIQKQKKFFKSIGKDPNIYDKINTEKGKEEIAKILHSISVIGFLYEDNIYQSHLDNISKYNFDFITITNEEEFISGDNPVIYGSKCIIFPINSKICFIGYIKNYTGEKIKMDIDFINRVIASNSDNLIFGSNETLINNYKSFIKNKDLGSLRYLDI